MQAGEVALHKLLDGKPQYQVPLFQRTYSWSEDEWEKLWEDILEIYAMEKPLSHFIGAVVTQQVSDIPGHATKHLLIDGQQRLTTLLILLSSVRRKASKEDQQKLRDEIFETCLVNKFAGLSDEFLKLQPTQTDRQDFREIVTNGSVNGNGRLFDAYRYFNQRIDEGDPEENPINLERLKSCITDRLELVSINLEETDSPHRIYESLNNTGMRLGPSDLIRNLIFMNIPETDEAQYAYDKHWFPMQEATGEKLDDFFWRFLMMDGSLPRWDETFDGVKQRFASSDMRSVDMLMEFSRFAEYYRWVAEIGAEKPLPVFRHAIHRLNLWEVNVSYPFIMKAFDWMGNRNVGAHDLVLTMQMIESFVVRRSVCSVPTNRLRRIFAGMSNQVSTEALAESSREYLLREQWPSDEEFLDRFLEYRAYTPQRLARTRLVLMSLEESFRHKEIPQMTEKITIEHIMPQNLNRAWRRMLGSNADQVHEQWLHTPGNLTMTGYNSELGDQPFCKKKVHLRDSKFSLTDAVLHADRWDKDAIEARGKDLAEKAVNIWKR